MKSTLLLKRNSSFRANFESGDFMENLLPSLAQSVAVAGFIAAAFSGVVLRPIYNVITELKEAIKELRDGLKEIEQDRRMMNERLTCRRISQICTSQNRCIGSAVIAWENY